MALLTAAGIGFVLGAIVGFIFQATVMYVVNPVTALVGTGLMFGGTGALASLGHTLITKFLAPLAANAPAPIEPDGQSQTTQPGRSRWCCITAVVVGYVVGAVIGLLFLAAYLSWTG